MVHDRSELVTFMQGETRLVYARYRESPSVTYFLMDGTAARPAVRELAREKLECLVPGCPDPRLKVVNRSGGRRSRRDGFAHYAGAGGHSVMSVFHIQSQVMIQRWLHATAPDVLATLEGWTAGSSRRADVLASRPDGSEVAFEVQFSSEPSWRWQRRHDAYATACIPDVWLFSNTARHLKLLDPAAEQAQVHLTRLQVDMLSKGQVPRWINPQDMTVLTPYMNRRLVGGSRVWRVLPTGADDFAHVAVEPLDAECALDDRFGLVTPLFRKLVEQTSAFQVAEQQHLEATKTAREMTSLKVPEAPSLSSYGGAPARPHREVPTHTGPAERVYRARSEEELAARRRCTACGNDLPYWQEGGRHIPACEELDNRHAGPAETAEPDHQVEDEWGLF